MENRKIRVAIAHGDTNGIGYEMILKAFASPELLELCTPIIYGSPKIAAYHSKAINIPTTFTIIKDTTEIQPDRVNLVACFDEEIKVDFSHPTKESNTAAIKALECAIRDFHSNRYDVLVSAPLSHNNVNDTEQSFDGIEHYLENCFNKKTISIYSNDYLRLATLTNCIAVKDIVNNITEQTIIDKLQILNQSLTRDYRISLPRIAILGLNPEANGNEENDIIKPAIEKLSNDGINVFGPFPAEHFFENAGYGFFDAVVSMYYDQGIIPLKTLAQSDCILTISGLPLVCTAPYPASTFMEAGQGITSENALRQAIYNAIDIFRNRLNYDIAYTNPLKKIYYEKKEDVEKHRPSYIKNKGEGENTPEK